jgi:uncharacterized membrane protein YdjX (TVP38/TMEM64 family)
MRKGLRILLLILAVAIGIAVIAFRAPLLELVVKSYTIITDREQIQGYIAGFGGSAPLVFIGFQILQVLLAPFPGEASGFIGGYLFGAWKGFWFSSVGLAFGSLLNFLVGRLLGQRLVRRLLSAERYERLNALVKHQGTLLLFVLFVFPGFPKDYLCLFMGITTFPLKVFIIIAAIGRMPGTLMLSLQGATVFEQNYVLFMLMLGVFGVIAVLGYRYRDRVYRWVEKYDTPAE